jgi:hypothetical protein
MFNELSGTYDIKFAERLFLDRCAEVFYNQNKKGNNDILIDAIKMQIDIIFRLIGSKRVVNLDESIAYCESLVKKYEQQS